MKQKFYRSCPSCKAQISYTSERCCKTANRRNSLCKVCVGCLQSKGIQNTKILSAELEVGICNKYNLGETVGNLAKEYMVSVSTIRRCLHSHNIVLRKGSDEHRKYSSNEEREKFYKESEYYKKYREANKEVLAAREKEKGKNGAYKIPKRLKRYNITYDEYLSLLEKQNYVCPICENPLDFSTKYPDIDHCHKTGKVRGIVHNKCNRLLACAEDNLTILQNAIDYLEENS